MISKQKYYQQTDKLIDFYKDKRSPIKEYLVTCNEYISELESLESIELYLKLEYSEAFIQILSMVEETFRPNQFISIHTGSFLSVLDTDFIVYILSVKKQLKKPLKWKMICELDFKFSVFKLQFYIKTKFTEDFLHFAVKNIKISELWNIKI